MFSLVFLFRGLSRTGGIADNSDATTVAENGLVLAMVIKRAEDHGVRGFDEHVGNDRRNSSRDQCGLWWYRTAVQIANELNLAGWRTAARALLAVLLAMFCFAHSVQAVQIRAGRLSFKLNPHSGVYKLQSTDPALTFQGTVGTAVSRVKISSGHDHNGAYRRLAFQWRLKTNLTLRASVRLYVRKPAALLAMRFLQTTDHPWTTFPDFSSVPMGMHVFSYGNHCFSPPQFRAGQSGTPWLLFDDHLNAAIISPASHFLVTTMEGNGLNDIAVGLNAKIPAVPANYRISSLMVITHGINPAWVIWGHALTHFTGKTRPSNEADWALRYLGYWTSNGCGYFCHFDPKLGYAGTLLGEIRYLHRRKVPVRYLQLDGMFSVDGTTPANRVWFPHGLTTFHQELGIPLFVYSTARSQWQHIAAYSQSRGAVALEYDWMNLVYKQEHFDRHLNRGNQFFGGMARAMNRRGLSIMYCMPKPCEIMQSAKYSNVTTSRVSNDFFFQPRWREFVFTSRLAGAVGIWPWTDACLSTSRYDILLQTLSAGMVGFGDLRGHENRTHITPAVRADGVIVKPDVPLVPTGQSYLNQITHPRRPIIARTYTEQNGVRTVYVFAFDSADMTHVPYHLGGKQWSVADGGIPSVGHSAYVMPITPYSKIIANYHRKVQFSPSQMGLHGTVYIYNYFTHQVVQIPASGEFTGNLGKQRASYYVCAATGPSGIAFIGDLQQYVGTGKARIPYLANQPKQLSATVAFAKGERTITLGGFAAFDPTVRVYGGSTEFPRYTRATGAFSITINPTTGAKIKRLDGQLVQEVTVRLLHP